MKNSIIYTTNINEYSTKAEKFLLQEEIYKEINNHYDNLKKEKIILKELYNIKEKYNTNQEIDFLSNYLKEIELYFDFYIQNLIKSTIKITPVIIAERKKDIDDLITEKEDNNGYFKTLREIYKEKKITINSANFGDKYFSDAKTIEDKNKNLNYIHNYIKEAIEKNITNNENEIKNKQKFILKIELEILLEKIKKNTIYFGAPGTGKSYKIKEIEDLSNKIYDENNIFRTTFHEAYSYSDFLGQYKPRMNGKDIEYSYCEGIFLKAFIRALKNKEDNVFLIIEEINRGNCAEIFGDVFQLLDRNKDGESIYGISTSEDVKEFLEKNKIDNIEKIKIPKNLYILATMNTSDQSLYPLDSAFKRRWEMEYIEINYNHEKIKNIKINYKNGTNGNYNRCLKALNKIITNETGTEDKQMGQFFIKIDSNNINYEDIKSKILQYLFFDVFKHKRDIFSTPHFSELILKEDFESCFNKSCQSHFTDEI